MGIRCGPDEAYLSVRYLQGVRTLVRVVAALVLLAATAFCGFGFLASFEPGNGWFWKVAYAVAGLVLLFGAVALLRPKGRPGADEL